MAITQAQVAEFNALATPLMEWIKANCSAKGIAVIGGNTIQLVEEVIADDPALPEPPA